MKSSPSIVLFTSRYLLILSSINEIDSFNDKDISSVVLLIGERNKLKLHLLFLSLIID